MNMSDTVTVVPIIQMAVIRCRMDRVNALHECLWSHVQLCLFSANHWRVYIHGWWDTEQADETSGARVEVRTADSCIHTYACVFVQCMCPREGVCVKERVRACVYVCV